VFACVYFHPNQEPRYNCLRKYTLRCLRIHPPLNFLFLQMDWCFPVKPQREEREHQPSAHTHSTGCAQFRAILVFLGLLRVLKVLLFINFIIHAYRVLGTYRSLSFRTWKKLNIKKIKNNNNKNRLFIICCPSCRIVYKFWYAIRIVPAWHIP
jgi:hypothetical protein